jgi:hypothetical protein
MTCPECKHPVENHHRNEHGGPPHVCHDCYAASASEANPDGFRWCWMGEEEWV